MLKLEIQKKMSLSTFWFQGEVTQFLLSQTEPLKIRFIRVSKVLYFSSEGKFFDSFSQNYHFTKVIGVGIVTFSHRLIQVEMFHDHGFKKWISLKIVVMKRDNSTFYACKIIKVISGFNLKTTNQVVPTSKKQLKYFSNTNNSTTLTPSGPQGCLEK